MTVLFSTVLSLHPLWVPRKLACKQFRYVISLTLHKSSWFTKWSHLTSVLLLVWAWIWIPRTMRKTQKKKIQTSEKSGGYKNLLAWGLNVFLKCFFYLLVGVLSTDQGSWGILRQTWRFSSLKGSTKTSHMRGPIFPTLSHFPLGIFQNSKSHSTATEMINSAILLWSHPETRLQSDN